MIARATKTKDATTAPAHARGDSPNSRPAALASPDLFQNVIYPKSCACGGGCPQCQSAHRVFPKLTVGTPGDEYEEEADRVAQQVMRMPLPAAAGDTALASIKQVCNDAETTNVVRRALVNVPTQTMDDEEFARRSQTGRVSRKANDGSNENDAEMLANEASHAVAHRDAGRSLSEESRRFFEPRFGADLSRVRLHEGAGAAEAAHRLNARAFTHGSDIWMGRQEREADRALLAHELVHVIQQRRPGAPTSVRRYVRTNTVYLWDVYDSAGRDAAAVTDAQLRTTIEYEDYTRADLVWRFSDSVAIGALRRSMDLFAAGVRGRVANYIRAGREARSAAHGISSIAITELGFTGDHPITSVPGGLGTAKGALLDDPDGTNPAWSAAGSSQLVAYNFGTPPTMFARFSVVPPVAAPVSGVQVRAFSGATAVGQKTGLDIRGGVIEDAGSGSGKVTGIGGGSPIPGAEVGDLYADFRFETSTDGGRIWFDSGSASAVRMIFTAATPTPPGGDLREDVLDLSWAIASTATAVEDLRSLVRMYVYYDPTTAMPNSFTNSDDVMELFTNPHQCDSQAYLLRYLTQSFGIPADVVYFWYGRPTAFWTYRRGSTHGVGSTFQCDRPQEDDAELEPHFAFHALTDVGGTLHDPSYNFTGLPNIKEHAPGATAQTGTRADVIGAFSGTHVTSFTCLH
jgi:hypothetical protein